MSEKSVTRPRQNPLEYSTSRNPCLPRTPMSDKKDDEAGTSTPSVAAAAAPAPAPAPRPSTYAPMGALRDEECANLLALVSTVSRPLEDAVADFLARVPPDRRLRFGTSISFVLEVRGFL